MGYVTICRTRHDEMSLKSEHALKPCDCRRGITIPHRWNDCRTVCIHDLAPHRSSPWIMHHGMAL